MRMVAIGLLVIAIAVTGLSVSLLQADESWRQPPWTSAAKLDNLSRAADGQAGALAVVSDSRQRIRLLTAEGRLSAWIDHDAPGAERRDFTEIAIDGTGGVVALDTVLDPYGLYVMGEQIVRYDERGRLDRVLYEEQGTGQSKRIGQLRGLQVRGESAYFYSISGERVTLKRVPLAGGAAEDAFSFALPPDRYLSEVTGVTPGEIYYTTKRGAIFRVMADGSEQMVYPLSSMDRTRKNFPEGLSIGASGELLFIDRLLNAVSVMEPDRAEGLRVLLDDEALQRAAPGAESREIMDVHQTPDGGLTVVINDRLLRYDPQLRLMSQTSEAAYAAGDVRAHWIAWGALALGVVLLAASLRLVYIHWLNRRFSMFFKQVLVMVPVIVASMILLSNFIYDSFSARMEKEMEREISLLARNGQMLIDGDRLARLTSPEDYGNEDYSALYRSMNFLVDGQQPEDRQGLYSTLYKYADGELFVIMDDDDGVNMFKPFELTDESRAVIEQGTVASGHWEDANGKWLYAIGPVYDSAGQAVGIYETGRDLNVLYQANHKIYESIVRNIVIITSVLLLVILTVTYFMLSSVRKLRRSVMAMADGNWDTEVKIRSRDEVGDLGEQFNRMARYIRQYIADITAFSEASYRFVPQQFFKSLGKKGIQDIRLGDQIQQNMVVMVANLRDFRRLSRMLTPKENFNFMNSFLSRFGPLVRREDGLISKYMGAGFMALFPGYAEEALRAAVAIRRELTTYNEHRRKVGYQPVDIGIAIHKGPLMLGIIGEEMRWESSVISDDVQRTTQLEQLSETLGASVLVTREFYEQLREPERFRHRSLGRIRPEGKEDAVELIDVYEGDPEHIRQAKDRTKALFERGLQLCQEGRFFDARETFVEVIKLNRLDRAAKLYFYLCDEYYQRGTSAGWNGTLAV